MTLDVDIIAASRDDDATVLPRLVQSSKVEDLLWCVEKKITSHVESCDTLLQALIQGAPLAWSRASKLRHAIIARVISILNKQDVKERNGQDSIGILLSQIPVLSERATLELVETLLKSLTSPSLANSGRSLEFLPKFIERLQSVEELEVDGESLSGTEYRDHLVDRLCDVKWPTTTIITLATILREIPTSAERSENIIRKLLREARKLDIQELPPFCYQLLLFASKGNHQVVISGLVEHFSWIESTLSSAMDIQSQSATTTSVSEDQFRQIEGTVLLHFNFALKQDQTLGKEILKTCNDLHLSPFLTALLLSLARMQTFATKALDLIKSFVAHYYKHLSRCEHALWTEGVRKLPSPVNARDVLMQVVSQSAYGWDHVTQSLVLVAVQMLDTPARDDDLDDSAHKLAKDILVNLFLKQEVVRSEILDQILSRVIAKADSATQFIQLLSTLVEQRPQLLLDFLPQVKEALEYLSYLPSPIGVSLLHAFKPLLRVSAQFQEYVVLVLRKAMFHRDEEARKTAASGLLFLVGHVSLRKQTLSVLSASQMNGAGDSLVDAASVLQSELFGNLRRSLTQQKSVREQVYNGLMDSVKSQSPLDPTITLEILRSQLSKFLLQNPSRLNHLPLVDRKADPPRIIEPIGHLLLTTQRCVLAFKDAPVAAELNLMLETLLHTMASAELEQFNLDKSSDFSTLTQEGICNRLTAASIGSVCEALVEIGSHRRAWDYVAKVIQLYNSVQSALTSGKGEKKVGKKTSEGLVPYSCPLSFSCLSILVERMCLVDTETPVEIQYWIFKRCLLASQQAGNATELYEFAKVVCPLLARVFIPTLRSKNVETREESTLNVFLAIIAEVCKQCGAKVPALLAECVPALMGGTTGAVQFAGVVTSDTDPVLVALNALQVCVLECLSVGSWKDSESIVELIDIVTPKLSQAQKKDSLSWIRKVCTEHTVDHVTFIKAAVSLWISLSGEGDVDTCVQILKDSYSILGDCNSTVNVTSTATHALVHDQKSALSVAQVTLAFLDKCLEELEWVLSVLKGIAVSESASTTSTHRVQMEELLFDRLQTVIAALSFPTRSCLSGAVSEFVLRVLTRLFRFLGTVVLHVRNYSSAPSHRFRKLVERSSRDISDNVYTYISFYHASTQDPEYSTAKIARQEKLVPGLVYVIEQYEKNLIKLSAKSKTNFMKFFKRSTARDFKIQMVPVEAVNDEHQSPSGKRKREADAAE